MHFTRPVEREQRNHELFRILENSQFLHMFPGGRENCIIKFVRKLRTEKPEHPSSCVFVHGKT